MRLTDNLNAIYIYRDDRVYSRIMFHTQYKYNHVNGTAIIDNEGYKTYYRNNKPHNESGPARINPYGKAKYCLNGIWIN